MKKLLILVIIINLIPCFAADSSSSQISQLDQFALKVPTLNYNLKVREQITITPNGKFAFYLSQDEGLRGFNIETKESFELDNRLSKVNQCDYLDSSNEYVCFNVNKAKYSELWVYNIDSKIASFIELINQRCVLRIINNKYFLAVVGNQVTIYNLESIKNLQDDPISKHKLNPRRKEKTDNYSEIEIGQINFNLQKILISLNNGFSYGFHFGLKDGFCCRTNTLTVEQNGFEPIVEQSLIHRTEVTEQNIQVGFKDFEKSLNLEQKNFISYFLSAELESMVEIKKEYESIFRTLPITLQKALEINYQIKFNLTGIERILSYIVAGDDNQLDNSTSSYLSNIIQTINANKGKIALACSLSAAGFWVYRNPEKLPKAVQRLLK